VCACPIPYQAYRNLHTELDKKHWFSKIPYLIKSAGISSITHALMLWSLSSTAKIFDHTCFKLCALITVKFSTKNVCTELIPVSWNGVYCFSAAQPTSCAELLKRQTYAVLWCLSGAGVPNMGYMYPWGYIWLSEGVHLRLAIEGKNYIYMLFIFKSLCICHLILFSKVIICLLLNISMKNHEKIFCHKEF